MFISKDFSLTYKVKNMGKFLTLLLSGDELVVISHVLIFVLSFLQLLWHAKDKTIKILGIRQNTRNWIQLFPKGTNSNNLNWNSI